MRVMLDTYGVGSWFRLVGNVNPTYIGVVIEVKSELEPFRELMAHSTARALVHIVEGRGTMKVGEVQDLHFKDELWECIKE